MNCPNCGEVRLVPQSLEANLVSLMCNDCGGHWIQSFQYWKWLDSNGGNLPEKLADGHVQYDLADGDKARICPECTRILVRCKVGHGIDFYLDRCSHCGGIWFDRDEWAVLKVRNLHDDAHFIFSRSWQDQVLRQEREESRERWFERTLGAEDFQKVREFRDWIQKQEHRSAVVRYITEGWTGGAE